VLNDNVEKGGKSREARSGEKALRPLKKRNPHHGFRHEMRALTVIMTAECYREHSTLFRQTLINGFFTQVLGGCERRGRKSRFIPMM
jgi:hypothetical protein